jgi:signal peptidase I
MLTVIANVKKTTTKLKYWILSGAAIGFSAYFAAHFFFPAYHIQGVSMHPLIEDQSIINASYTFTPPKAGEVFMVKEGNKDFVKRVVGLPGDSLTFNRVTGMLISRNGKKIEHRPSVNHRSYRLTSTREDTKGASFTSDPYDVSINGFHHVVYGPNRNAFTREEKLMSYTNKMFDFPWLESQGDRNSKTVRFTLPEGKYFVLSDNRVGSKDSRQFGLVDKNNLAYRVVIKD